MSDRRDAALSGDGSVAGARSPFADATSHGERVMELQERERVRIAFDLHDGPAQSISAALLQIRMADGAEGDDLRTGLASAERLLTSSLDEMYAIIEHLQSRALDEADVVAKLESYTADLSARAGLPIRFTARGPAVRLSDSARIALFRIVQEALSNVVTHAGARSAEVSLSISTEAVECVVTDDGRGFVIADTTGSAEGRHRYGLLGMCERARLLGGDCAVSSELGRGTRVTVRIPVWRGE